MHRGEQSIEMADKALYKAKKTKNRIVVYEQNGRETSEGKIEELRALLHKAIISGEVDDNTILNISRELDKHIVEYIKQKGKAER